MKSVLFVCTGNICRSPMAEGLFLKALADRGVDGVEVESTGIAAMDGWTAEPLAQEAVEPFGVDLSGHRARIISEELIRWADSILVMTPQQRDAVVAMVPEATDKVRLLGAYGPDNDPERAVPDPYGGSAMHYRACTVELLEAINGFLDTEGAAFGA